MSPEDGNERVVRFPSAEIVLRDLDFHIGDARGFLHVYAEAIEEELSIAESIKEV